MASYKALDSGVRSKAHTAPWMSNCCSVSQHPAGACVDSVCPRSGTRGKQVDLLTVKALLTEAALSGLQRANHYFCLDPACDIVYFDAGGQTYSTSQVRVSVWHKTAPGSRTLCYCFGETEAAIQREIQDTGRSAAEQRIRAHLAAGRCACEIRNPRGICCLGDVAAAIRRLAATAAEPAVMASV